jgi:indole-3-glycerol phosphate synthase
MSAATANNGDFLNRMAELSLARIAGADSEFGLARIRKQTESAKEPVPLSLSDAGFDLIAELKQRSPSEGELGSRALPPVEQARRYMSGGAAAISVLTEPHEFSGSMDDLRTVSNAASATPVMRKDFLVRPYQVLEARAAGASGVLLIAAILDASVMRDMLSYALERDMFVLMEVFDERDLDHCLPALQEAVATNTSYSEQILLGVNCRDLRSLQVDFARFAQLAPRLPKEFRWVAESGIHTAEDAAAVANSGYSLGLVGTALMRSDDPAGKLGELVAAGRAACS